MDENIVEHKGTDITKHDVTDSNHTADHDDQEVEQYRDDTDGGQDLEEYAAEHVLRAKRRLRRGVGRGGWLRRRPAEEDECRDGEDNYGANGDDRWDHDGDLFSESDDGVWAVHEWCKCRLHARRFGG